MFQIPHIIGLAASGLCPGAWQLRYCWPKLSPCASIAIDIVPALQQVREAVEVSHVVILPAEIASTTKVATQTQMRIHAHGDWHPTSGTAVFGESITASDLAIRLFMIRDGSVEAKYILPTSCKSATLSFLIFYVGRLYEYEQFFDHVWL